MYIMMGGGKHIRNSNTRGRETERERERERDLVFVRKMSVLLGTTGGQVHNSRSRDSLETMASNAG